MPKKKLTLYLWCIQVAMGSGSANSQSRRTKCLTNGTTKRWRPPTSGLQWNKQQDDVWGKQWRKESWHFVHTFYWKISQEMKWFSLNVRKRANLYFTQQYFFADKKEVLPQQSNMLDIFCNFVCNQFVEAIMKSKLPGWLTFVSP